MTSPQTASHPVDASGPSLGLGIQSTLPQRVAIHVTAFCPEEAAQFLRDLAKQNGGDFRVITP